MTTLDAKIAAAIQEHLPSAVAGELKTFIAEAEIVRQQLVARNKELEVANSTIDLLSTEKAAWERVTQREVEVTAREKKVGEESERLDKEILKIKLEEACKRADTVTDLAKTVFRNPVITRTAWESKEDPTKDQYGGTRNLSTNKNETISES